MSANCTPKYWFLDMGDDPDVTLRETGKPTKITKNTLLPGRISEWKKLLKERDRMAKATDLLLAPYTSNNLVTPLVDGKAYMGDLYLHLQDLKSDDFVLLAGWEFTMGQPLNYDEKPKSQLPNLLDSAIKKGNVRLLAWDSQIPFFGNQKLAEYINQGLLAPNKTAYVDANLDGAFLSHHQKQVVIGKKDWQFACAYVGGIDLAADRWDDGEHKKKEKENNFIGWHDIQVKVQGDAVMQIWANFAERWVNNDTWLKKSNKSDGLASCPQPTWSKELSPGSHHVQVLRTVTPVRSGFKERSMPFGERTVLCALQKAISLAEYYIYIEEQFLWECELADFIAERMEKNRKLKLIVVIAAGTELPLWLGEYSYHLRSKFFMKVMDKEYKEEIAFGVRTRVWAYGLFPVEKVGQPVYVHSKLVIIDDRYVAVGSANFDARSMFIDTELTLGIVDDNLVDGFLRSEPAKVCRFARELREQLWKEHLGVKDLIDHDFDSALTYIFPEGLGTKWPAGKEEAKKSQKHHIRCYVNKEGSDTWITKAQMRILDRNERHW